MQGKLRAGETALKTNLVRYFNRFVTPRRIAVVRAALSMQHEGPSANRTSAMPAPLKTLLALALLGGAAAQADPAPDRRAVTVSGQGEVSAAPDRARLSMAVEQTDTDLKAAQAKVNGIVRAYLAQARALGA